MPKDWEPGSPRAQPGDDRPRFGRAMTAYPTESGRTENDSGRAPVVALATPEKSAEKFLQDDAAVLAALIKRERKLATDAQRKSWPLIPFFVIGWVLKKFLLCVVLP